MDLNLVYNGTKFDSQEEVFVAMWLDSLTEAGIVDSWTHDCDSFPLCTGLKINFLEQKQLKTKVKTQTKTKILLRPSVYTPDFKVVFTAGDPLWTMISTDPSFVIKDFNKKSLFFTTWPRVIFLEVKPSFSRNNMERLFINNQKYMWDKYKKFINLVDPEELFKKTFMPKKAAPYFRYKKDYQNKKAGDWKTKYVPKTLKQFLYEQ